MGGGGGCFCRDFQGVPGFETLGLVGKRWKGGCSTKGTLGAYLFWELGNPSSSKIRRLSGWIVNCALHKTLKQQNVNESGILCKSHVDKTSRYLVASDVENEFLWIWLAFSLRACASMY